LFYFSLAIGIIGSGIWLYNLDMFNNSTLESIKDTNQLIQHSQTNILKVVSTLTEKIEGNSKINGTLLTEIKKVVYQTGADNNIYLNSHPEPMSGHLIVDELT
jgi:hypothetical protein